MIYYQLLKVKDPNHWGLNKRAIKIYKANEDIKLEQEEMVGEEMKRELV